MFDYARKRTYGIKYLAVCFVVLVFNCIHKSFTIFLSERFPVGQNIAKGNAATNSVLSYIKQWFDQVDKFNKSEVTKFKL